MKPKASLLLVDDNVNLTRTMSLIFSRKGYEVATAKTGFEAIDKVKEKPYDIIFMDIKMPVMDGVDTFMAIKKVNPEAVVVMMTAYRQEMDELVNEAIKNNAYTCMYKPFDMEGMLKMVEDIMKWRTK